VVSNPPYVSETEYKDLEPEIFYEPKRALVAGRTGLEVIKRIVEEGREFIAPGGWITLEVGAGQAGEVAKIMQGAGYKNIFVRKDLLGIERVVAGHWEG